MRSVGENEPGSIVNTRDSSGARFTQQEKCRQDRSDAIRKIDARTLVRHHSLPSHSTDTSRILLEIAVIEVRFFLAMQGCLQTQWMSR
jgi:hypothetical protein